MGKTQVLLLILIVVNCTASRHDTITTNTIRAVIDTDGSIPERTKVLLGSQLDDLDRRLEQEREAYFELDKQYKALNADYVDLQEKYAESQRDAGYKDTLQFQVASFMGIVFAALLGTVLFLIYKGKIRIPGLVG